MSEKQIAMRMLDHAGPAKEERRQARTAAGQQWAPKVIDRPPCTMFSDAADVDKNGKRGRSTAGRSRAAAAA